MSTAASHLPHLPREVVKLGRRDALLYDGLQAAIEFAGGWRYPAAISGDFESMGFLGRLYWLYKSSRPIHRAERGSGLESFFRHQPPWRWEPPEAFSATSRLTVSAAGDLMAHPFMAASADTLYREIGDLLFGADLSMANLECVVLDRTEELTIDMTEGPPLAMDVSAFRAAAGAFDLLSTACNHTLDFGEPGIATTIAALRSAGIAFNGINETEADAHRATIIERNGVRVGVVAYSFGLNAHRPPRHRPNLVNRMNLNSAPEAIDFTQLEAQLRHCRAEAVDFVIAQLHWGMEFEHYPRRSQRAVAHRLAELGVDAIFGHHPHVLQPVEHYRTRRDPARVVPIFYSLGNLTNPFSVAFMCRSGVARLELVKGAGKTYVSHARLVEVDQVASVDTGRLQLRPALTAP